MRTETEHDLLVLGGGSAAFAAAIRASEFGARSLIVNTGLPLGGTCVNVGCIPSKAMVRAAEAATVKVDQFDGVSGSAHLSDYSALAAQTGRIVEELRLRKYRDIAEEEELITLVEGRGEVNGDRGLAVNGRRYEGKAIVVATGARTFVPSIPGLVESGYLTTNDLYRLTTLPEHLIILGGGFVALENAQTFARLGSRVTIVERSEHPLPEEASDLVNDLCEALTRDGVELIYNSTLRSVERRGDQVILTIGDRTDSETEVVGSHLFLATGRRGNTEEAKLQDAGVRIEGRGFVEVDSFLRTSVPTILAAGDVLGKHMFVYTAAYEGALAASNGLEEKKSGADYIGLPWVLFTDPQLAGVGLDLRAALQAGHDAEESTVALSEVPWAIVARRTTGRITLVRDRATDRLLGCRILAPEAGELLTEATLAIRHDITLRELASTFHPYLTRSEGMKLAAIGFDRDVTRLSCCAT